MKKIGDILNIQNIPEKISKQEKQSDQLARAWKSVMGKECGNHTRQLALKNGILHILVDTKVWQQELLLTGKEYIVEQMKNKTGNNIIDIKIKAGG